MPPCEALLFSGPLASMYPKGLPDEPALNVTVWAGSFQYFSEILHSPVAETWTVAVKSSLEHQNEGGVVQVEFPEPVALVNLAFPWSSQT
jgi:hypothetical protein